MPVQPIGHAKLMEADGRRENTEAGKGAPLKPRDDEVNLKNAKLIRKRTGVARWIQKLAKSLERNVEGLRDLPEGELAPGNPELEL